MIRFKDLVDLGGGARWVVLETRFGDITFTLNDDGSLYIFNPDGAALQDTERLWLERALEHDWHELRNIDIVWQ